MIQVRTPVVLVAALAWAGCGNRAENKAAPAPAAAAPSAAASASVAVSAEPTGPALTMKPGADWGAVHVERAADVPGAEVYTIKFDAAPGAPIKVQLPKNARLVLEALPSENAAKPLESTAWSFELTPAGSKKPSGFRFKTTKTLPGGPLDVAIAPVTGKPGALQLDLVAGETIKANRVLEGCTQGAMLARAVAENPTLSGAAAALSAELERQLPSMESPDKVLRAVLAVFGRGVNVERLRKAANAEPCPSAPSLEFACALAKCSVKLNGVVQELKTGDSLSLASGPLVEFLNVENPTKP